MKAEYVGKANKSKPNSCTETYSVSAVRKILYTTNAVESVNSSFRKVTKKGAFPNENALLKLLYLRVTELYKKWNGRPLNNRALVRNQLDMDEKIQERIRKYEHSGF